MSGEYYLIRFIVCMILLIATKRIDSSVVTWLVRVPATVYLAYVYFKFHYEMWSYIQDRHARTTPEKAAWLILIPIYNMYWVFVVYQGFAEDYNKYITRHNMSASEVDVTYFRRYAVFCALSEGLTILLFLSVYIFSFLFSHIRFLHGTGNILMTYLFYLFGGAIVVINLIVMALTIDIIFRICNAVNALSVTPIHEKIIMAENYLDQGQEPKN